MKTKKLFDLLEAYRVYDSLLSTYRGMLLNMTFETKVSDQTLKVKSVDDLKIMIADEFYEVENLFELGLLDDAEKKQFKDCFIEWYNTTYEDTKTEEKNENE